MLNQRYTIAQYPISAILTWVGTGNIAIPNIQRPFVWDAPRVSKLLTSLLKGFPVGYLISWQNPNVRLKDGSLSVGRRILIDGQQRVMGLRAALLGYQVMNDEYRTTRIQIAYDLQHRAFEVASPNKPKDKAWLPDISVLFAGTSNILQLAKDYNVKNPDVTQDEALESLLELQSITNNTIGMVELDSDLDIETVTDIFAVVNSSGVPLSTADFAMSRIAVNEKHDGPMIYRAVDHFCHLAVEPEFARTIEANEAEFAHTDYYKQMVWLEKENDDLFDPSYKDMLRVAFSSQFGRGKLTDLVALLSGRNPKTRQFEEAIMEESFRRLGLGIRQFINEENYKQFLMIIRSAGFVDPALISSKMALDFAYILYLILHAQKKPAGEVKLWVARWFVMSVLTERYSGSTESSIDEDLRQISAHGIEDYAETVIRGEISDAFWDTTLPQKLDTSSISSPAFRTFEAAQVKLNDLGFLSRDITVKDLIEVKSDVHHVWPRDFLKRAGYTKSQYNQVANYAVTPSEINISIGNKEPSAYMRQLLEQCHGGRLRYGSIVDESELRGNLAMHCIPDGLEQMTSEDYPDFLDQRRHLMAQRIHKYFKKL